MNIIVVGLSHKTAPVELRELLAIPASRGGEALARFMAYAGVKEGMFLSTCNRVEVYGVVDDIDRGFSTIQDFFVKTHLALSIDELLPHLYWYADERAIAHLFRVTGSLDSMVVGEPQILGQVKEAFEMALTHHSSGVILNKIVRKAISVGKSVRTNTRISEFAVSISSAAVELAKKVFSNLQEKTVLLVGTGEMGKLAAQHLVNQGIRQIILTTRQTQRAIDLAERFSGVAVPFEDYRAHLVKADIVLCATGAPHYVVSQEDVLRAVRERKNRPMFLIDISVPRNIDPLVKDVDNAFLFDIDDLETHVGANRAQRRKEAERAEAMVKDEVGVMLAWLRGLDAKPTIVALRKWAEAIKDTEVEKALARLGPLSSKERGTVEGLASSIINKVLHGPLVTLKMEAQSKNGVIFIEAARRFFDLPDEASGGQETLQKEKTTRHPQNLE